MFLAVVIILTIAINTLMFTGAISPMAAVGLSGVLLFFTVIRALMRG